jgi:phage anti-repressor protein
MESLNIVNLIEINPITKLSSTYNSKLLTKIKENFTDKQQQLFVSSFYCYLNFNQKNDFVIDLDEIYQWVGFAQKVKGKVLLEKYFKVDIDYQILLSHVGKQEKSHGGNNKEKIMLNIKTFKLFCIKAGTQKANEIHEYFIKLEEILYEVVQEESNELKLQLEHKNNEIIQIKENHDKELISEKELEKQKVLLKQFGTVSCIIYIIKVKSYDNGEYVIKIGESRRGITNRFNEHKINYDEILLLDCFMVNRSKDFESFLHHNDNIKPNKVKNLVGHENERELFLIGKNLSYASLSNIITNNIKYFDDCNFDNEFKKMQLERDNLQLQRDNLQLECDKLRLENEKPKSEVANTNHNDNSIIQTLIDEIASLKMVVLDKQISPPPVRTMTNFSQPLVTMGPRLQKINPETLQLVRVYETVSECMNEDNKFKRPSLNKAVIENTIYFGFRWLLVDRDLDANIITNIEVTKITKIQNLGYIAKVNKEKTEILNVYIDRKTAAIENGYFSTSSLDTPVKNMTLTNGNYYLLYDSCEENVKNDFILKNSDCEPLLYKNGVGQYDSIGNLLKEFGCKYDCIRILKMSDKTLAKALDKDIMYNNYYYKTIGSKLKCFV